MFRVTCILCALLLAACAEEPAEEPPGEEARAAASQRVVACELVPGSAVEDIMGAPVEEARPDEYEDSGDATRYMTSCTYVADTAGAMRTATVQLARMPELTDPTAELQRFEEGLREMSPGLNLQRVPELGPGAGWHPEIEQLTVFRPGWRLVAGVDSRGAIPGLEGARLLASRMLDRIQTR